MLLLPVMIDCNRSWLILWNKTYLQGSLNIDASLVDIFLSELLILNLSSYIVLVWISCGSMLATFKSNFSNWFHHVQLHLFYLSYELFNCFVELC